MPIHQLWQTCCQRWRIDTTHSGLACCCRKASSTAASAQACGLWGNPIQWRYRWPWKWRTHWATAWPIYHFSSPYWWLVFLFFGEPVSSVQHRNSHLSFCLGIPYDQDGNDLQSGTPPCPLSPPPIDENSKPLPFYPYRDHKEYKLANF